MVELNVGHPRGVRHFLTELSMPNHECGQPRIDRTTPSSIFSSHSSRSNTRSHLASVHRSISTLVIRIKNPSRRNNPSLTIACTGQPAAYLATAPTSDRDNSSVAGTKTPEKFYTAIRAANPRKPLSQVPPFEKLVDGGADDRPPMVLFRLKPLFVNSLERVEMVTHQREKGRSLRVASDTFLPQEHTRHTLSIK